MRMLDLIAKKRTGGRHSPEEIRFIVQGAARETIPDYQLSAWLMAVCWRGMTRAETVCLTREMADSGARLDLGRIRAKKVDKHSTGGVGDGVSLALAPLVASAGLTVPMMSGRGLGHTGGTLDKLESLKGFQVRPALPAIGRQLSRIGVCMFGQSRDLAPADRKLYALRDVTSTVESLPLIVGSILSKKVAENLDGLVLDVKVGSGAIFQDPAKAVELARALVKTAQLLGVRAVALLTAMEQPLGRYVGNALEIRQAVEVLRGDFSAADYVECLFGLGGWMVHLGGKAAGPEQGAARLRALIASGEAFSRFKEMLRAQGADPAQVENLDRLPRSPRTLAVKAPKAGFIVRLDARIVGETGVLLGAGRSRMDQTLDYGAGIVLERKLGARVSRGDTVAVLHGADKAGLEEARSHFLTGLSLGAKAPRRLPVIRKILRSEAR
jgi:pyrimidine-nucleoside phosphorylase